jgi:hypothetical protein
MLRNLSNRMKLIALAGFVIALIAIPLTIIQVQKQQSIRQHAASIDSVSFDLSPQGAKEKKGESFSADVHLLNSSSKDISSVDVIIQYDASILGAKFQPNPTTGYTTVLNETKDNTIHYVAVNVSSALIIGTDLPLGTLTLTGKADGKGKVSLENVQVTAAGNPEKLNIDTSIGTLERQYAIGDINPSLIVESPTPTPTPTLIQDTAQLHGKCLKICEQGTLISKTFGEHELACIQDCDSKYKQPESIIATPTPIHPIALTSKQSIDITSCKQSCGNSCAENVDKFPDQPACINNCVNTNCLSTPTPTLPPPIPTVTPAERKPELITDLIKRIEPTKCEDTDANEKDPFTVKGEIFLTGKDGVRIKIGEDYCMDTNTLMERTCNGNESKYVSINCDCTDGACVPLRISEVSINPPLGKPGTTFTIQTKINSLYDLVFAKATIEKIPVTLYDDGKHGDGLKGDGVYGNVLWYAATNVSAKEYNVLVEAKDVKGNTITSKAPFAVTEDACKELVAGYNTPSSNRINLVFVGINFDSLEDFRNAAEQGLDSNGTFGGLFSQEPFASNKDKFNFWYIQQIGTSEVKAMTTFLNDESAGYNLINTANKLSALCAFNNKFTIALSTGQRGFASSPLAVVSALDTIRHKGEIIHEFGHSFGLLRDEYLYSDKKEYAGDSTMSSNLFLGTVEQCNSKENKWYDLYGDGCGVSGKADCVNSQKCNDDPDSCRVEVACFEGADKYIKGVFRPGYNTVMRDPNGFDYKNFRHAYGSVNERLICDQIRNFTGSSGGICNSIPEIKQ